VIRLVLRDDQWERLAPLVPGKEGDRGRSGINNRMFVEGVLWIARVGAPWRDLPAVFGNWNSVFKRFRRWAKNGVFERCFNVLSGDPDFEYALIDGTLVRVHQHGTGAKGGPKIRRSGARAAA
jgi:transposase